MNQSQIRQSLMRIKQNQAKLLNQLRTEHTQLQDFYLSASQANPTPSQIPTDNSLQLSKSEGNLMPYQNNSTSSRTSRNAGNVGNIGSTRHNNENSGNQYPFVSFNYVKSVSTSGAQELIQSKNRKIEELLNRQRKVYEQNHVLQQENQALLEDYRQLKKMYYQTKEAMKDSVVVMDFMIEDVLLPTIQGMVLQIPHEQLAAQSSKKWSKYKTEHSQKFPLNNPLQPITSLFQKSIQKITQFLSSSVNNKINTKTKQEQISELKQKITNLINMNNEINKTKYDLELIEKKRLNQLEKDNVILNQKIKRLEKEIINIQERSIYQGKEYEGRVVAGEREVERLVIVVADKQMEIGRLKNIVSNIRGQVGSSNQKINETDKQLKIIKQRLRQKQQQYNTQIQLSHRQSTLIQKLTQDLQMMNQRPPPLPTNPNIISQNQRLNRQLASIQAEYNRYRDSSQREINSLITHNKEIKNQYATLIKSEENLRLNQMRYRQLVAVKGNTMKMGMQVEHLWAVKEIQYGNLVSVLDTVKEVRRSNYRPVSQQHQNGNVNVNGVINQNTMTGFRNSSANGVQYLSPTWGMRNESQPIRIG